MKHKNDPQYVFHMRGASITSENSKKSSLKTMASVGGSGWGVTASASVSYTESAESSSHSASFVMDLQATVNRTYLDLDSLELDPVFAKNLENVKTVEDANNFIEQYGRYFVYAYTSGCDVSLKATLEAETADEMSSFNSEMKATYEQAGGVFSITGSASFDKARSSHAASSTVTVESIFEGMPSKAVTDVDSAAKLAVDIQNNPSMCSGTKLKTITLINFMAITSFAKVAFNNPVLREAFTEDTMTSQKMSEYWEIINNYISLEVDGKRLEIDSPAVMLNGTSENIRTVINKAAAGRNELLSFASSFVNEKKIAADGSDIMEKHQTSIDGFSTELSTIAYKALIVRNLRTVIKGDESKSVKYGDVGLTKEDDQWWHTQQGPTYKTSSSVYATFQIGYVPVNGQSWIVAQAYCATQQLVRRCYAPSDFSAAKNMNFEFDVSECADDNTPGTVVYRGTLDSATSTAKGAQGQECPGPVVSKMDKVAPMTFSNQCRSLYQFSALDEFHLCGGDCSSGSSECWATGYWCGHYHYCVKKTKIPV
eukprot:Nk52_evm49s158 gene=Nk52_evmTU49s158